MIQKLYEARTKAETEGEGGFTLIELLIVIVVLAILAAAVIFGLSGITGDSAQASCNSDAKSTEIAVEAYHSQHGVWPTQASDLTTVVNGHRYLRSFADANGPNKEHYVLSLPLTNGAGTGVVAVQAFDGNGTQTQAATDYDTTPNPCTKVG
jgi:prepilin-type N-terminal cleavage/methylation domain-containing protein